MMVTWEVEAIFKEILDFLLKYNIKYKLEYKKSRKNLETIWKNTTFVPIIETTYRMSVIYGKTIC